MLEELYYCLKYNYPNAHLDKFNNQLKRWRSSKNSITGATTFRALETAPQPTIFRRRSFVTMCE